MLRCRPMNLQLGIPMVVVNNALWRPVRKDLPERPRLYDWGRR